MYYFLTILLILSFRDFFIFDLFLLLVDLVSDGGVSLGLLVKGGDQTLHVRQPLLVVLAHPLEVMQFVQNRLVRGQRHKGDLVTETLVFYEQRTVVL